MRLDKYLKVSRIIKRRTVANEACDAGRVLVNGKVARASYDVKQGDVLELQLGSRNIKAEVVSVNEYARKEEAGEMYRVLSDEPAAPRACRFVPHMPASLRIEIDKRNAMGGIGMTEEKKIVGKTPHSVILENRKAFTATGVSNVDSFDEQTIVAYTDLGELVVKGKNLHINKLNVETGELTLDGEISSLSYAEPQATGGGIFAKLFK